MSAFGGKADIPSNGSADTHFWADTVYAKLEGHDGVMLFPKGSATLDAIIDRQFLLLVWGYVYGVL